MVLFLLFVFQMLFMLGFCYLPCPKGGLTSAPPREECQAVYQMLGSHVAHLSSPPRGSLLESSAGCAACLGGAIAVSCWNGLPHIRGVVAAEIEE